MILNTLGKKILFTSDMNTSTENSLLKLNNLSDIDILQLPRGGRQKISEDLLNILKPEYIVSSTYTSKDYKARELSTQKQGGLIFTISHKGIEAKAYCKK